MICVIRHFNWHLEHLCESDYIKAREKADNALINCYNPRQTTYRKQCLHYVCKKYVNDIQIYVIRIFSIQGVGTIIHLKEIDFFWQPGSFFFLQYMHNVRRMGGSWDFGRGSQAHLCLDFVRKKTEFSETLLQCNVLYRKTVRISKYSKYLTVTSRFRRNCRKRSGKGYKLLIFTKI